MRTEDSRVGRRLDLRRGSRIREKTLSVVCNSALLGSGRPRVSGVVEGHFVTLRLLGYKEILNVWTPG